ncbi:BZ3500_MvSof-1268-A1-R1_Chr7-1g09342 [Microbotryum saponariae]|uniref:BZ3500_MvSof-1268-A1-R1_Chr7-1g09342 protein n=1 Tax=Microbotryum saponariae TaxID=289078 RepID=A0A2X0L3J6_9BASI|nr:BZ3501_MvSof-1269-A2-R1_Chr7-1g09047 [Microbotryum saponariae]SDA03264.1 BZ3500_MvSof-1268-A1-R1_Chr7-1g09342 [Microbotryum saponariae]
MRILRLDVTIAISCLTLVSLTTFNFIMFPILSSANLRRVLMHASATASLALLFSILATIPRVYALPAYRIRPRQTQTMNNLTFAIAATSKDSTALSSNTITLIKQMLNMTALESWEIGAHIQALLEYDYPVLAVFFDTYTDLPQDTIYPYPVMSLVGSVVSRRAPNSLQLMPDGSAADPASIGVATILANYSIRADDRAQFGTAAEDQLEALLLHTPRTADGAISHRADELSLWYVTWADSIYMVPPFLAYYGTINANMSLIQEAYDQCRLYRQNLRNASSGLYKHILWGSNPDPDPWATGNAWAAAGMIRVWATIMNSNYASDFASQANDLASWTMQIVEAAFSLQSANLLFHNYLDNPNTFTDAASTALLTAVSFRLAQFKISESTLAKAQETRIALHSHISSTTGLLSPVVDPLSFGRIGQQSPEGQAFVLMMEAAWADYTAMSTVPNPIGASETESLGDSKANASSSGTSGARTLHGGGSEWTRDVMTVALVLATVYAIYA